MQRFDTFVGALRYEFRMQIRRRSVWITFIALGLFFIVFHQPWYRSITTPAGDALVYWTGEVQSFLAIAVGILLADRLPRDRRTKVEEVLDTLPGAPGARAFGKYLGSTLATFAAIVLPGILFIGAFSIGCPAILWVPLYQFLFVGYWFWGNLLPNFGIPTLSETILTPVGGYMCTGFFNPGGREGVCSPGIQGATALQGVESILLLLGIAGVVSLVLSIFLKRRQLWG